MKPPLLASQVNRLDEVMRRMFNDREHNGVLCFGPSGCAKTETVLRAAHDCHVKLIHIENATKFGIIAALTENPTGHYWLDDFDEWMSDLSMVNLFKRLLDPTSRRIGALNRDTLRSGKTSADFSGTITITCNTDPDTLPRAMKSHMEALAGKFCQVNISHDLSERLKYIDYMVCEMDYFRNKLFRKRTGILPLSLDEIQDVLNYLHKNAHVLPMTLRMLNDIARERKLHADGWQQSLQALHVKPQTFSVPRAPIVPGWRERHPKPSDDTIIKFG